MSILQTGSSIALYHILPAMLGALIYYLLATLFIFIFRIKKPSLKFGIYILALYKSVLILLTGARYSNTMVPRKAFGLGFNFYDPIDLLPFGDIGPLTDVSPVLQGIQSPWLYGVISIVISVVFFLLILRWIATAWFFKNLAKNSNPLDININNFIKNICSKLKVSAPNVVTTEYDFGPMTIGIFKPIIVLPRWVTSSFSTEEIEVIVGHELAHVKRRDNIFQWITLFLRDVLFFSPFSRLAYNFVQSNKEQAADSLFLKIMPEKSSLLTKTIKKVASKPEKQKENADMLLARANFIDLNLIQKRVNFLDSSSKASSKRIVTTFNLIGLFIFFWIKAFIVIKVGLQGLMLLS